MNVVLVGDSLTKGYYDNGRRFHAYSAQWPATIRVTNLGVSGAMVTPTASGLWIGQSLVHMRGRKYDTIVFMGGTNDLGHGLQLENIWTSWKRLAELMLPLCVTLVVLTVPNAAMHVKNRDELNDRIRWWASRTKDVTLVDVNRAIPFDMKLYDDGLHFNPHGYDRIGQLVYETIKKQGITYADLMER